MAKKGIKESDKSAVSPVIGVILLVAITVLLSAVVGAIVLGMGGSVEKNVRAGVNVDFEKDDDAIRVLFAENENAKYVNVTMSGWGDEIHVVMWGVGATVITDTNKGTVEVHGGGAVIDKPNDAVKSTGPPCGSPPCGGGGPGGGSGGPPGGGPIGPPGSGTGGPGSGSGGPGVGPGGSSGGPGGPPGGGPGVSSLGGSGGYASPAGSGSPPGSGSGGPPCGSPPCNSNDVPKIGQLKSGSVPGEDDKITIVATAYRNRDEPGTVVLKKSGSM